MDVRLLDDDKAKILTILLKQYEVTWNNVLHNEKVRDNLYNFYLIAYSFLMLGSFHIYSLLKETKSFFIIIPFFIIILIGFTSLAILSRLRMVINRDNEIQKGIMNYLIKTYPDLNKPLGNWITYFTNRNNKKHTKLFNLNRLIDYQIIITMIFSCICGLYLTFFVNIELKIINMFMILTLIFILIMLSLVIINYFESSIDRKT